MPVYGGKPFGSQGYGDTPDIAIPELIPAPNGYGDIAFGSDSFGGSSLDNSTPSAIGVLSEQSPDILGAAISGRAISAQTLAPNDSVSAGMVSVVIESVALSFGDATYGAVTSYGGLTVNSAMFSVAINETQPIVNADIGKVSFSVAVEEPSVLVESDIIQAHDLVGEASEGLAGSLGSIIQSIALIGDSIEPAPAVSATAFTYYVSGSVTEPIPTVSVTSTNSPVIFVAVAEPVPIADGSIKVTFDLVASIAEPNATINATIAGALNMQGDVKEALPIINGHLNDNAAHVTEQKPVTLGVAIAGNTLQAVISEKPPVINSSSFGERLISAYIKEPKPTLSAINANGSVSVGNASSQPVKVSAKIASGALITGNVIDIKPVVVAKFLADGLLAGAIVEQPPIVVSKISNIKSVVIADDITAYSFNTENMAMTEYTNYQFTALSEVNGKLYGIKSDGVYLLEGIDDNGIAIESEFLTGKTDADQDRLKRVPLIHAEIEGDAEILLQMNDVTNVLPLTTGRAKPGRGMRATYLAFGAKSSTAMKVQSIEPTIDILKKRAL